MRDSNRIKSIPEEKRNPNPILDSSWKRVDAFGLAPQLNEAPLKGSEYAIIDPDEEILREIPRGAVDAPEELSDDEEPPAPTSVDPDVDMAGTDEDEWEYEEDELYLTLDLGSHGMHHLSTAECALTGLTTKTPMFKIGRSLYKGEWDEMIGTEILLYDHKTAEGKREVKPLTSASTVTQHLCEPSTTQHRIMFTPMGKHGQDTEHKGKQDHLAEFKNFPGLSDRVGEARKHKKKRDELTYAEQWEKRIEAALKRREKLAAEGHELHPTRSIKMSRPPPKAKDPASENGEEDETADKEAKEGET